MKQIKNSKKKIKKNQSNKHCFFTTPVTIAEHQLYEGTSSFNWLNRFVAKTFICKKNSNTFQNDNFLAYQHCLKDLS